MTPTPSNTKRRGRDQERETLIGHRRLDPADDVVQVEEKPLRPKLILIEADRVNRCVVPPHHREVVLCPDSLLQSVALRHSPTILAVGSLLIRRGLYGRWLSNSQYPYLLRFAATSLQSLPSVWRHRSEITRVRRSTSHLLSRRWLCRNANPLSGGLAANHLAVQDREVERLLARFARRATEGYDIGDFMVLYEVFARVPDTEQLDPWSGGPRAGWYSPTIAFSSTTTQWWLDEAWLLEALERVQGIRKADDDEATGSDEAEE